MTATEVDTEGYTLEVRKAMINRVLARVHVMGLTPAPEVAQWYKDYGSGQISRVQLMALIYARVDALSARVAGLLKH